MLATTQGMTGIPALVILQRARWLLLSPALGTGWKSTWGPNLVVTQMVDTQGGHLSLLSTGVCIFLCADGLSVSPQMASMGI